MRSASAGWSSMWASARLSEVGSPGFATRPVLPAMTSSGTELTAFATTGMPQVMASTTEQGSPSQRLDIAKTSKAGSRRGTSSRSPSSLKRSPSPLRAIRRSVLARRGPSPTQIIWMSSGSAGYAEQAAGVAAGGFGGGWDAVDRADQRADPVGRRDLQADRFGGDEGAVGEKPVGDPAEPSLDGQQRPPRERRLELVEREAVDAMDDGGHAGAPRHQSADHTRFRAVGVDDVEAARGQVLAELAQRVELRAQADAAAAAHAAQAHHLEAALLGALEERAVLGREDRRRVALRVQRLRFAQRDPPGAGREVGIHVRHPQGARATRRPARALGGFGGLLDRHL